MTLRHPFPLRKKSRIHRKERDVCATRVLLTAGRASDARMAHHFDLPPGSIVAVDRGYNDFRLFARWMAGGVFFVTRPMHHITYAVVKSRPLPQNSNIRSDEIIRLSSKMARQTFKHLLRRIAVWDADQEREIVLLTNHFDFAATTLAQIYKDRWEIELFFKALKQNLKIKSFVGTTENALHIQIWTALIAMLLLKWLHHLSQANWSLSNLATMLRLNLFTYRDLRDWLHNPFGTPPIVPGPEQLVLSLA